MPLVLFAAVVAPLLLCPDRRDGVLALYATRPITPSDYVASRWSAFLTVSAVVVWLPEAVLFVWNLLDASDTGSWIGDNWDIVPRFIASGLVLAVSLTTLALLVSSFTTRRAYAAIGTLAVLFIGGALGGIARGNFTGTLADVLSLADLTQVAIDTEHWIFGDELSSPVSAPVEALFLAGADARAGRRGCSAAPSGWCADERQLRRRSPSTACRAGSAASSRSAASRSRSSRA